uniref:Uncharacterized protein n=1 Tax=Anguilla anguilla TaxID=7936 RepID=A0A0E9WDH1_ANGAN
MLQGNMDRPEVTFTLAYIVFVFALSSHQLNLYQRELQCKICFQDG